MKVDTTDPMSFWISILQNPDAPYEEKKWASVQLGPFAHPKLASVESRNGGKSHEQAERDCRPSSRGGAGDVGPGNVTRAPHGSGQKLYPARSVEPA
jgi:hypothetical protein